MFFSAGTQRSLLPQLARSRQNWRPNLPRFSRSRVVVVAPRAQLILILRPSIRDSQIVEIEVLADPDSLRALDLAVLDT
jgi:hypothetical protein